MNRSFRRLAAQGFTLIELLIVVIIIAILAAIAIPQFANTSNDAQSSALSANLSTMRSAIELYKVQHKNVYPSVAASNGNTSGCTGTGAIVGTGAVNTNTAFNEQLTMFSDSVGNTCSVHVGPFIYGPYIRAIPMEQISNPAKNDVAIVSSNTQDPAPTDTTGGYQFDNRTGRLVMNSNAKDQRGVVYSTY